MAGFIERNKKKGLLALLLYIARRGKAATGIALALVGAFLVFFLGTPEAVRQRVPWAPRGFLTRGLDTSNSGLGADEQDVAMRLSEEKGEGMESLTRRMLNGITGPRQPVVDMVAAKNADLQEPSAQKQLGDKLSKHGKGIRGIVRKEDSTRGSASIALSQKELQQGLAHGPERITQPQASMRQASSGGAPIGGGSQSDFSGQAQIGNQAEAGAPGETGGPPEVGGPPPDTTSLISGGGEPIPDARAGDANFDLMAGTYGGGSSGGNAEMAGNPCPPGKKDCLQWKAEKDKSTRGGDDVFLKGYTTDIYTQARLQLAEVKAYSFAAAPPGGGPNGVSVEAMVVKGGKWTTQHQEGQCPMTSCPKEYASVVADAPFQKNLPKGGLVHVAEDVDLTQTDPNQVADYAERVKEMDALAKKCEDLAKGGYNSESKENLMNDLMKASDKYLNDIKNRTVFGNGNPEKSHNKYLKSTLLQECGLPPSKAREGKADAHWAQREQAWQTEVGRMQGLCQQNPDCPGHLVSCGKNCTKMIYHRPCSKGNDGIEIAKKLEEALDKLDTTQQDHKFCTKKAQELEAACVKVKDGIANKRSRDECQGTGSEFNIYDAETQDTKTEDGQNLGKLDCKGLVWNSSTGGRIVDIVRGVDSTTGQAIKNMGRDDNFTVNGKEGKGWQ